MSNRLTMLIVEDNPHDVRRATDALREAGYKLEFEQVRTEAEYLAHLGPELDVILADDSLPRFSVPRALELLRDRGLDVPLIVISGAAGEDRAARAIQQGAADCLPKDRPHRLGPAVARSLEQRRLRQANRAAEAAAVEWRNRYEAAVRASGQLLYDWDPHTDQVVYGGDVERVLGYSPAEMAGGLRRWLELLYPDDVEPFVREIEQVRASGRPFRLDYRVVRKGGAVIYCEDRGHFVRDAAGRVTRMVGFVVDMTERKGAERQLIDSRRMLEMVLNSIPIGVFWKDRQSRYLGCNHTVARAFGLRGPEEIVGRRDYDMPCLTHEQADFFVRKDREVMESNSAEFGIIEPATLADGTTIWMETAKLPMHNAHGDVVGVLGIWQDVTEKRRLEEQYRQAAKMEAIGRLAGGVAHDFNNLLTVITGYSQMLAGEFPADDPRAEPLIQIRKAGDRAARLTRQLLAFSRKSVLVPTVLDLNALLADMRGMLAPLLGEDVDLVIKTGAELGRVKVDAGQVEQVVLNLAVNARDAMPAGGQITVETMNVTLDEAYSGSHPDARAGEFVLLAVSDTGVGMDSETRERIFEPFFTTKGPEKGTGLGLAMVYGIVKQSGGHVEVYSEPGLGSTFKIYLPRERSAALIGTSYIGIRPAVPRGSETVLLTEDEDGVRKLARLVLERVGYRVLEARHGAEALEVARACPDPIALLITDVVMPNLSGPQLAARLLGERPATRVLYLSGYTDDAIVRHGIIDGNAPFLQKPFSPDALALKVRAVLDSPA